MNETPVSSERAAEPAGRKRGRGCLWATIVVLVLLAMALIAIPVVMVVLVSATGQRGTFIGAGNVALIRIEGVITATGGDTGLLSVGGTSSEKVLEQIRRAEKDSRIKAILLRIDSPGGTAAGGQEIASAVHDAKKPVVASVADLGASAAYMVASQADHIVCAPAGLVGSIGVIMEIPNYEELYKKIGIRVVTLHAGQYKDIGSPTRPMLPEERRFLEKMLRVVHEQFIRQVAEGRDMPVAKVRKLATGLFWTGEQAKELDLIDEVGGYDEALAAAKRLGGIEGEPQVVEMGRQGLWDILSRDLSARLAAVLRAALEPPQASPSIR